MVAVAQAAVLAAVELLPVPVGLWVVLWVVLRAATEDVTAGMEAGAKEARAAVGRGKGADRGARVCSQAAEAATGLLVVRAAGNGSRRSRGDA